jgi:predicted CxxxxCH...CXXCH cytochrome family protein
MGGPAPTTAITQDRSLSVRHLSSATRGTRSSNPLCSRAESSANFVEPTFIRRRSPPGNSVVFLEGPAKVTRAAQRSHTRCCSVYCHFLGTQSSAWRFRHRALAEARVAALQRVAKTTNQLALMVDDANPRPKVGDVAAYGSGRTDFADVENRLMAIGHAEATRAVQVLLLGLELTAAVEDLHPVVLTVGDVDPAIGVAADVVKPSRH